MTRKLEFLRPLTVTLLTQRRGSFLPYGAQGGEAGAAGRNRVRRAGSEGDEILAGVTQLEVQAGDQLIIETPGGGGWGRERGSD